MQSTVSTASNCKLLFLGAVGYLKSPLQRTRVGVPLSSLHTLIPSWVLYVQNVLNLR